MTTEEYIKDIRTKLENLQREKNIIVLYAAVCGSRAYGLNHPDSDCDTHFVFVYPMDMYLNVTQPSDYISLGDDINGYELRKFLGIIRKSGFNAAELINSPLNIMGEDLNDTPILKGLVSDCLNPKRLIKAFCGCTHNAIARFNDACRIGDATAVVKQLVCATRMFFSAEYLYSQAYTDSIVYPPLNFDELVATVRHVVTIRGVSFNKLLHYADLKRQGPITADDIDIDDCMMCMAWVKEWTEYLNTKADELKDFKLPNDIEERMNKYFKRQLWSSYT